MNVRINLPIYDESRCYLFALGRNAMYAACELLDIGRGDEILTPAFDCDDSLQPFKALGCDLIFFRSDAHTLGVNIQDIREKITSKTKLLHIINHFGFAQPWEELLQLRRQTNIPILEDNAYSLFSSYDGKQLGMFGDFSVFSLRKNLPLIDGGMLRINNPAYNFKIPSKNAVLLYPSGAGGVLAAVKSLLGWRNMPLPVKHLLRRLDSMALPPPPLYSDKGGYPVWPARDEMSPEFLRDRLRPMSIFARRQISGFSREDFALISEKKRYYYNKLSEGLSRIKGITVLWPRLPEGVVPFNISFLVDSGRDVLFNALRGKYEIMAWPTLSKAVLNRLKEFPEVEALGRQILQINLPAEKILNPSFTKYGESIVKEITFFSERSKRP